MADERINLKLDRGNYPQILQRYSLEEIKDKAINMALAQFKERPVTEEMMYSCLSNLESDLEECFLEREAPVEG
jgi:hypothetical protein